MITPETHGHIAFWATALEAMPEQGIAEFIALKAGEQAGFSDTPKLIQRLVEEKILTRSTEPWLKPGPRYAEVQAIIKKVLVKMLTEVAHELKPPRVRKKKS